MITITADSFVKSMDRFFPVTINVIRSKRCLSAKVLPLTGYKQN